MTTRTLTLNVVLSLLLWSLLVALFLILSPVFAHAQGCPAEPIGSVTVNPTKTDSRTFAPGDRIIVLAEG